MKTIIILVSLFSSIQCFAETKATLVTEIRSVAEAAGVDPDLAVAIAKVESSLNPNAVGGLGEIGLFQMRPEYHNVIKGKTKHNTVVAITFLSQLQSKYGERYGNAWFVLYNYGPGNAPKDPTKTTYYHKVMREITALRVTRYLANN